MTKMRSRSKQSSMLEDKAEGKKRDIVSDLSIANDLQSVFSGMAIQGPDGPGGRVVPGQDVVQDILKRARE